MFDFRKEEWNNFDIYKLKITIEPKIFIDGDKISCIQIRNIDYTRPIKLLIGCGNCPIETAYSDPFEDKYLNALDKIDFWDKEWKSGIKKQTQKEWDDHGCNPHQHTGWVTIDPNAGMNPTIIGYASTDNLKDVLPDGSCSHVAFEGLSLDSFTDEIIRLLGVTKENIKMSYDDNIITYAR